MAEETIVVGGSIGQHLPMPGSVAYQCAECPKRCWLEPASQQLLAATPDATVICFACFLLRRRKGYEPDSWEWTREPGVDQQWIRRLLGDAR